MAAGEPPYQYPWMPLQITAKVTCPIEGCGWSHTEVDGRETPRVKHIYIMHLHQAHPQELVPDPLLPSPRKYFEAGLGVVPEHWHTVPPQQKEAIQQMLQMFVNELRNDGWEVK